MNSIDFCFWLQGHFEISGSEQLTEKQVKVIKNHLNLVFKHEIDPIRDEQTPTDKDVLNYVHSSNNDPLIRC
ncbi:MAG: hypothetical protein K0U78_14940 [Actinomycetia bacterium]|nr:hypothetical protein [Actinomycetes bacterium]